VSRTKKLVCNLLTNQLHGANIMFMWPCIVTHFFVMKSTRWINFTNLFCLFYFRTGMWIAVQKPVWHIPLLGVQLINSWWWTDKLSETCRVSWQNKFVKLLHLFGFITKKFHGANFILAVLTVACLGKNLPTYADTPMTHYGAAPLSSLGLIDHTLTIYHFWNKFNIIPH
jgi:hypothetical protein